MGAPFSHCDTGATSGYTPCTVPYNTSYLCHVMLSYVVYIILYYNDDCALKTV